MSIIEKLSTIELTESEKSIVQYLLNNYEKILQMTVRELSQQSYVSQATIIRFVTKLGFERYNDFKIAIAQDMNRREDGAFSIDFNMPIHSHSTVTEIADVLSHLESHALCDTANINQAQSIVQACKLINAAQSVEIYGSSLFLPLLVDFKYSMARIGKRIDILNYVGEQRFSAFHSNDMKCAILITYSGNSNYLKEIYGILRKNGTKTVLVTSLANRNYEQTPPDCTLYMTSKEDLAPVVFGRMASRTSLLFLFDMIYSYLFAEDYQNNLAVIKNTPSAR